MEEKYLQLILYWSYVDYSGLLKVNHKHTIILIKRSPSAKCFVNIPGNFPLSLSLESNWNTKHCIQRPYATIFQSRIFLHSMGKDTTWLEGKEINIIMFKGTNGTDSAR